MSMRCVNGHGEYEDHKAEGWIVSPDGRRISPMCRRQAQEVIDEYASTLDETWTFDDTECRHIITPCRHIVPKGGQA